MSIDPTQCPYVVNYPFSFLWILVILCWVISITPTIYLRSNSTILFPISSKIIPFIQNFASVPLACSHFQQHPWPQYSTSLPLFCFPPVLPQEWCVQPEHREGKKDISSLVDCPGFSSTTTEIYVERGHRWICVC